jgi:hypothetical protein
MRVPIPVLPGREKIATGRNPGSPRPEDFEEELPEMRPSDGRMSLWPLAVIALIVVLSAASITPVLRLNSAPPADFAALRISAKGADADLAGRYWDAAINVTQWKYSRTAALPEQAPEDFRLTGGNGAGGENQAARFAYWARLREEWLKADNWHTAYSFDLNWIARDLGSLWSAVASFVNDHS